ncbi:hypothetical protein LI177_00435 [bacterium 210820-DFI.6.37]|nr:hypothetical protein [bacterium 210820-DFI.6.37]
MKYELKKEAPSLAEVIKTIYAFCVPDSDSTTAYGYLTSVNNVLFSQDMTTTQYAKNENAVWLLVEKLQQYDRPKKVLSRESINLDPFVDWNMKNVDSWFSGETKKMQESTLYQGSGYYSFGLINLADCKAYIQYFFDVLGIEENASFLYDCATMLNWNEDLVLFTTYILLGCSKGSGWLGQRLQLFEEFIDSKQDPVNAATFAERSWLTDVSLFRPRSIEKTDSLSMQDFYVRSDFESQYRPCSEPMKRLSNTNTSVRSLIVSQTGMGKSMYMRMTALCLARELLETDDRITALSNDVDLPNDMYVIYIPAYMFSYCYQKQEYKAWTDDFVKLYFNCMFRLSCAINFDKHETRDSRITPETPGYTLDEQLLKYISVLAQNGKLVLIADSFDEIVPGQMRQAYLQALQSFRETYCNYPEAVGAHIFMTSRDMSQSTMEALASSMAITLSSANVYRIKPLSVEQQKELIINWDRFFGNGIRDNINELNNHYFTELCSNPYMLSVACNMSGTKINLITDKLISSILYFRTRVAASSLDSDLLRSVLESKQIKEILQDLALETVELSLPHFSLDLLAKHCMTRFADLELSEDEFNYCYDILITLFTTSVGLIVPADNEDDRFQFMSNQIRYELAASKISGEAFKRGSDTHAIQYCNAFLSRLKNDNEYILLIVPLICKMVNRTPVSESLIMHLALRTFDPKYESLAIRAMIDLLLGRYGLNITCSVPNKNDSMAYEHYVNADRLIMMRLLSSPVFSPKTLEKQSILQSNALKVCDGFLSDYQIKLLH